MSQQYNTHYQRETVLTADYFVIDIDGRTMTTTDDIDGNFDKGLFEIPGIGPQRGPTPPFDYVSITAYKLDGDEDTTPMYEYRMDDVVAEGLVTRQVKKGVWGTTEKVDAAVVKATGEHGFRRPRN